MTSLSLEHVRGLRPADVSKVLLTAPEGQWFERKSGATKASKAVETIIAMANADGGVVAFGIADRAVQGVDRFAANTNELMQAGLKRAEPPIRTHAELVPCEREDGERDHILLISVDPSEQPHATTGDSVFLRVGDETRRLSFVQRQELVFDKGQGQFEARVPRGAVIGDLDDAFVDEYVTAVHGDDRVRTLQARGAVDRTGRPTHAGVLLFGREPQEILPEAYVRIVRYRGIERGSGAGQTMVADEVAGGAVPQQLRVARDVVRMLQPTRRALRGGRFSDVALIPEDAWLEGIVNAAIHRSYSLGGDHIRVELFDDRIEVESPGRFPGLVDVSDPGMIARFARNPRIARVCSDLAIGQELGEGIRRMVREMHDAGLTAPIYRQTAGSVRLTLSADPVHRALDAALAEDAARVVRALREATRLSTGELQELMQVSRPVVIRRLRELEGAGLIVRHGRSTNDPRAYWTNR